MAESVLAPDDPTFEAIDQRRQAALRRAVGEDAPDWTDDRRAAVAALLDAIWNLPAYERLVAHWNFDQTAP